MPYGRLAKNLKVAISSVLSVCMTALSADGYAKAQIGRPTPGSASPLLNCFMGQNGLLSQNAANIASEAVVGLNVREQTGHVTSQASGFIIKNSGSAQNPHNRIVTAMHVTAMPPNGWIQVYLTNSNMIGRAKIAATSLGMTVLEMDQFEPQQERNYDKIIGLTLGPQDKHNYITGVFSKPAGITAGNSGGPILDANGQVIGVVQSTKSGSKKSIIFTAALVQPFLPGTKNINKLPISVDEPNRMYATTLADPVILGALNNAGKLSRIVSVLLQTASTVYGMPNGGCLVSTGEMKTLEFNSIADFKAIKPEPVSPSLQFHYWDDSKLALNELKSLLNETYSILPSDNVLATVRKTIESERDINKVNLEGLPMALVGWANAVHQPVLAQRLMDACYNIDAWRSRSDLLPSFIGKKPKAPMAGLLEP